MSKPITVDLLWQWDSVRERILKLLDGRPPIYLKCSEEAEIKKRTKITALLRERGIMFKDLCEYMGVSKTSLRNKFMGLFQLTESDVEKISGFTGISPEEIRSCVKAEEYE